MATLDFGLFDWIDRSTGSTGELYQSRLELIEMADKNDFYGYHLAEHHGTPLGLAPSPSVFFAAVAERTRTIRFSPMAYLLPLYHPIRLIEEVCMLDNLSNGRVEVGISRGVSPYEIKCFGVEPETSPELFEESLAIFQAGMSNDVLDHQGTHYQLAKVPMTIKPQQRPYPPLWYPSFSESGTRFAAREGFNFLTLGPPGLVAKLAALYREVWTKNQDNSGRINAHVTKPKIGAMRQIFLAETDQLAMEIAEAAYADWYQSITELWHQHNDSSYDDFFAWEACLASETILVGSVEKVRDQIQALVTDSGINYFVGSFAWGSLSHQHSQQSLQRFISEIMPAVTPSAQFS